MSVRDFLNKGIHIADVDVAAGSVPEAAPTLVTDGYATVRTSSNGPRITLPFVAVWVDFVGGASPTATLNLWGYIKPPAAGAELSSDWQLIDSVVVSDSVGLTPTLALIPLPGLDRFCVTVNAITGAPTNVKERIVGISAATASTLVSMGAAAGMSANVNLVEVNGVSTGLTADGFVGVAGRALGGTAIPIYVDGDGNVRIVGPSDEDNVADGAPLLSGGRYDATPRSLDDGDVGAVALDIAGRTIAVGAAAEDAAVAGDPVLFGGRYDATPRSLDDGDVGAVAVDDDGNMIIVGNVAHDSRNLGRPILNGYYATDTLITAVGVGDRVYGTGDRYGRQYIHSAAHDVLAVADSVVVGNGPETQHDEDVLADITNAVAGPTYYYLDMLGYTHLSLQFYITSGSPTLTFWGTVQANVAIDARQYYNEGNSVFGSASWTANITLVDNTGKCGGFSSIRVGVAGSGTEDLVIYYKRWY